MIMIENKLADGRNNESMPPTFEPQGWKEKIKKFFYDKDDRTWYVARCAIYKANYFLTKSKEEYSNSIAFSGSRWRAEVWLKHNQRYVHFDRH